MGFAAFLYGRKADREVIEIVDEEKLKEKVEEYLRSLQEKGFRITSQRRLIVETILQNWDKHPNVRELLDLIQEKDPSIGLATIYRTVELLVEMGFLHEVNLDEGFSRFEVSRKDIHFHLVCRGCGKVVHLEDEDQKSQVAEEWAQDMGFTLLPQSIELFGVCHECLEKGFDPSRMPQMECRCRRRRRIHRGLM